MTWCDIDDILYDGNEQEMNKIVCPECGGHLKVSFYENTLTKECLNCGIVEKNNKSPLPKCIEIFGDEHIF